MSQHLEMEQIVAYLDGTLSEHAERTCGAHLDACDSCRARLAELEQFDRFVQCNQPGEDLITAAMFEVSEQVLNRPRLPRRWGSMMALVAAALLVGTVAVLWSMERSPAGDLAMRITRYQPAGLPRSAPPERFHVDLDLAAPGYVAVFAKFADGQVKTLAPLAAPAMAAAGPLRLPGNELLDWEYPADQMPAQVLVVVFPNEPAAALLAEVEATWYRQATGSVPAMVTADGCRAQLLPMPPE
jgi:hypothetical protein